MMEDDRYEWRKQTDPDFIAAVGSSGGSASKPPEGGMGHDAADDEFDAALKKRRKHRKEMKANTHNKLDRLIAGCPSRMRGGGARQGGRWQRPRGEAPDMRGVGSYKATIGREGPAGPENAAREYEERKAKRDPAEQDRIDKDDRKRANVARNLDGKTVSEGFFASFGEAPTKPATDVPLTTLQYLRTQLTAANNKETIHGTKLNAPNGPISSGITKLSNLIHRQN